MSEVYEGWVNGLLVDYFYPEKTTDSVKFTLSICEGRIEVYHKPSDFYGFCGNLVDIFDDPCNPTEDEFTLMELETGFNISKEYRSYLEGVKK